MLSGGWDNNVHLWDIRDKKSIGFIFGPNISGDTLDYKDNEILTGSHRNIDYLEKWDLGTRKRIDNISWDDQYYREGAYVYAAQFDKKFGNNVLAACSGINEVKMFDGNQGNKEVFKAYAFEKGCYTVDFGNKQGLFAFAGGDGNIVVYNIK